MTLKQKKKIHIYSLNRNTNKNFFCSHFLHLNEIIDISMTIFFFKQSSFTLILTLLSEVGEAITIMDNMI